MEGKRRNTHLGELALKTMELFYNAITVATFNRIPMLIFAYFNDE